MQDEQMVDLLRRVRHDYANHLQVIGGYLDLGQPEKVKDYLHMVWEEIISERIIFESQAGGAALYFYEQVTRAQDLGIILRYEDLDIKSWDILRKSDEPCRSLANLRKEELESEDDMIVYLSLYEDELGIDMFFSCADWQSPKMVRVNKE